MKDRRSQTFAQLSRPLCKPHPAPLHPRTHHPISQPPELLTSLGDIDDMLLLGSSVLTSMRLLLRFGPVLPVASLARALSLLMVYVGG